MKRFLIACSVSFAFASGAALAADLPLKAPPLPPPPPSWTGCYVDAGSGYGLWNQDHYDETIPGLVALSQPVTSGGRGWLGRVGAGCDYQFRFSPLNTDLVIGLLGNFDWMDLHGTASAIALAGSEKEQSAWYGGARIGALVTPRLLAYFDGGYTETRFGQINLSTQFFPVVPVGLDIGAHDYHGWFLGSGTEYAFTWLPIHGLFWRNEYRYSSYESSNLPLVVTATGAPTGFGVNVNKSVQTVSTELVWRFNWTGR